MEWTKTQIGIVIIIAGGAMGAVGYREIRLQSVSKADPQTITCADLEDHGPGDNAHVILTDFYICEDNYVYVTGAVLWKRAWVPAIPKGSDFHRSLIAAKEKRGSSFIFPPSALNVIVKLPEARYHDDIVQLGKQSEILGTIVNVVNPLDGEEKKLFEEGYPGVDFDNVWVLEVGTIPGSAGKIQALIAGCILCAAIGVWLILKGWKEQ